MNNGYEKNRSAHLPEIENARSLRAGHSAEDDGNVQTAQRSELLREQCLRLEAIRVDEAAHSNGYSLESGGEGDGVEQVRAILCARLRAPKLSEKRSECGQGAERCSDAAMRWSDDAECAIEDYERGDGECGEAAYLSLERCDKRQRPRSRTRAAEPGVALQSESGPQSPALIERGPPAGLETTDGVKGCGGGGGVPSH
eukprot:scaffold65834_cov36-Tisochrysis_lutea.AAC.1